MFSSFAQPALFHAAYRVVAKLQSAGFIAYFAGGCVRDYLLNILFCDIDIATNATPKQVQNLFSHTTPIGIAFGIVLVHQYSHAFEVATFRQDIGYNDGRHPDQVVWSAPQEDAQRRDFTINGIFYDPVQQMLIDFVEGRQDILKGTIRAIGDPERRFKEDRLRMLRAVRFSHRLHFPIEEETNRAIEKEAPNLLQSVAIERIWQELQKMQKQGPFAPAVLLLHQLGLLQVILPKANQLSESMLTELLSSYCHFQKETPTILYLLHLLPMLSEAEQMEMGHYFKVSNATLEIIQCFVQAKRMKAKPEDFSLAQWLQFYAQSHAWICLTVAYAHADEKVMQRNMQVHVLRRQKYIRSLQQLQEGEKIITAQILMQEGVMPGKNMGVLLQEAQDISLNQQLFDVGSVLQCLKQSAVWPKS